MAESKSKISTIKKYDCNEQNKNHIRLRIELNSVIKFYIRVDSNYSLLDVKNTIDDILKKTYSIVLPQYSLRSTDGFEIVEMNNIIDVLDDNQIIIVDPFTRLQQKTDGMIVNLQQEAGSHKPSNYLQNKVESNSSKAVKSPVELKKKMDEINSINLNVPPKKSRVILPKDNTASINVSSVKESICSPLIPERSQLEKDINDSLSDIDNKSKNIEETEKENISKKKETKNIGKHDEIIPVPRPDNFKGFVVNKSEFDKPSSAIKIDESSFKPLKKRKIEEEKLDFDF